MVERAVLFFTWGLILGSFANVCIHRLPLDQSLFFPASHCPHCHKPLKWWDNVPVLGFLLLRGRCRACREPIAWRYIAVEMAMGLAFMTAAWILPASLWVLHLIYFWLVFNWITTTVIDYQHRIIPDELSLSLIVFGWIVAAWNPLLGSTLKERLMQSGLAAIGAGGGMLALAWLGEKVFKKEALGGGDVKLLAGFGAVLGWSGAGASLVFGSFAGALVGIFLMAIGKKKMGQTMPFGPFLNIGAVVGFLVPGWWHTFFPGLIP